MITGTTSSPSATANGDAEQPTLTETETDTNQSGTSILLQTIHGNDGDGTIGNDLTGSYSEGEQSDTQVIYTNQTVTNQSSTTSSNQSSDTNFQTNRTGNSVVGTYSLTGISWYSGGIASGGAQYVSNGPLTVTNEFGVGYTQIFSESGNEVIGVYSRCTSEWGNTALDQSGTTGTRSSTLTQSVSYTNDRLESGNVISGDSTVSVDETDTTTLVNTDVYADSSGYDTDGDWRR